MENWLDRTELLIGKENISKLKNAKVAVFGLGGVGSFAAEALVRSGIGDITLIDNDIINITNINRQLMTDTSNIGICKVDACKQRYTIINPDLNITTFKEFYNQETSNKIFNKKYDYVIDAIDCISSKICLVQECFKINIPIISAMGTGNKLEPTKFEVSDIYNTSVCPLAKIMRKELRKRNIPNLKVVYSKEQPKISNSNVIPSISFVPSVCGLILAGEVIKDLIK